MRSLHRHLAGQGGMEQVVESLFQAKVAIDMLAMPHSKIDLHIQKLCVHVHARESAAFQPLIVAAFERLSAALWQDANFAEKKTFILARLTVEKMWESVKWLSSLYDGGDRLVATCWLGGLSRDKRSARICDRILATGLYLIDFQQVRPQEAIDFLNAMSRFYENVSELAERLIENDERLMGCVLVLQKLNRFIGESSVFEYRGLCAEIFQRISYDENVVIEWLQSEVMSAVVITRIVRDIIYGKNALIWQQKMVEMSKRSTHGCALDKIDSWMEELEPLCDQDTVLVIKQLAGEKVFTHNVRISASEPIRTRIPRAPVPNINWNRFIKLFIKLSKRMKILGTGVLGFNPNNLIRLISEMMLKVEGSLNLEEEEEEDDSREEEDDTSEEDDQEDDDECMTESLSDEREDVIPKVEEEGEIVM